jgi:tripartite ATP-independent transporter DctM subunit
MLGFGFVWVFLALMALGVPIVFAMLLGPIAGFLLADRAAFLAVLPQKIYQGINQFPLLAIPLFILAGELMNVGGITERIIRFSNALVGHLRGGLAQVDTVACMFFSGLSGSAVADASALGSVLIPAMDKAGYGRAFAAAVTAASAVMGPIIPPSIIMVVYAYTMQVSVAALFLGGFLPGFLVCAGLMVATAIVARRRGYPKRPRAGLREVAHATGGATLPLLAPVIILGGIVLGIVTPTEAAGVAVVYALLVGMLVYRRLRLRDLNAILLRSGIASATILLVIGAASVFGWAATLAGLPARLAAVLLALSDDPTVLLVLVNVLLLLVGMFLDAGPAILILGPILAPTMAQLGVDPIHFALIMCVNLSVGLATPPVGLILFATSSIARVPIERIAREMLPYYVVHVLVIAAVTYVPWLTLALPRAFGFA